MLQLCDGQTEFARQLCKLGIIDTSVSALTIICLGSLAFYLCKRRNTKPTDILYMHNWRFSLLILILFVQICGFAEACIAINMKHHVVVNRMALFDPAMTLLATIAIATFVRTIELQDQLAWLYLVILADTLQFIIKICKAVWLCQSLELLCLQPVLMICSSILFLLLTLLDSFVTYKESQSGHNRTINWSECIGYKHPQLTFLSRVTFWWLTPLLWRGWWKPLELEDLGNLSEEDTCRYHYDKFLLNCRQTSSKSLWGAYMKTYWRETAFGGVLRLFSEATTLVGPLGISLVVDYVAARQRDVDEDSVENRAAVNSSTVKSSEDDMTGEIHFVTWRDLVTNGWFVAVLILLASVAQGTLSQSSTHIINMVGIHLKAAIQGLIYRKTLSLSPACFRHHTETTTTSASSTTTTDDQKRSSTDKDDMEAHSETDAGSITNLMTEDAENIMSFFWIIHYVWSIPLKISIVIYLLYVKLGWSAVFGSLICVALMTPLQFLIGKMMSKNAEKMSLYTDERLNKLNEILLGIRIIKLNAWVESFKERLHSCREKELKPMKLDCIYWTALTFLTHVASILIAFVTLAIANGYEGDFSSSRLFSALALFNQLTIALFIFPITVPITISAIISTRRIEAFMALPDVHKEVDGSQNVARVLSRGDNLLDIYENEDLIDTNNVEDFTHVEESPSTPGIMVNPEKEEISSSPGHRSKSKLRKSSLSLYTQLERNRERRKMTTPGKDVGGALGDQQSSIPDSTVLRINDGVFTWNKNHLNAINLTIQHLQVNKGALVMVVGSSGSGKSSLLAALLREIHLISGSLVWNRFATVAYVSQTPWVLNTSIRENILFGESFRPKRYDKVVEACSLKPDIELMPEQDSTVIGEQGINLSGGQRQRIALARALYSSANVIIMDDPFSALDHEVTKFVFENGIKKMLIRHKRTSILVTQNLQLIRSADMIIVMENHKIRTVGTLGDIKESDSALYDSWQKAWSAEDGSSSGRTARERWKLFKNVAKLGLQKVNSPDDGEVTTRKISYMASKFRSSIYGSRFLAHDIPLPIDECYGEEVHLRRRPSRWLNRDRAGMLRIKSLQTESPKARNPVSRNISSPTRLETENRMTTEGDECSASKLRFYTLLRRLSTRRSAPMPTTSEEESTPSSRHCRKASATNSIQSIEEEEETEIADDGGNGMPNKFEEERKYGEIPLRIYWQYLKDCGLGVVVVFCLIALSWQILRVLTDVWLQSWTNTVDQNDAHADKTQNYFNIYAILSGGCVLLSMLSTPIGQYAGLRARRKIHTKLLDAILGNSLRFFQTTPLGRIMNRFSNDMAIIDKKIAPTSQRLLQFLLLCFCSILINSFISPWFLLLSLPICAVYYGVQHFYRSSSRELQRIENIMSSPILSHFTETIQGVATIRAYNQEARFMEILFRRMETNNVAFVILNTSNRWLGIALDYLGGIIVFVAIITALSTAHIYAETTPPSMVGLAINYTLLIPIYLNWVVKLLADMEMYVGAVERIEYYIKNGNPECTDVYKPVPISWPQRGDIVFENVSCRYGSQEADIISNLSLQIPAGQRIGVCGRTGSGKSSLALALFGALHMSSGRILIDDVNIAEIHVDELRSRLSIIPQDVVLFRGTVRDNLDPRGHFSDIQCWNCLEMAQIKTLIQANPAGLDAQVEENGWNFSVGQRQLFCLARAVLRGSVCLILDEATSSLDPFTEQTLLAAANAAFQGRTIIMITHRLSTLLAYERVILLEAGRVVEEGCPKVLKDTRGSKFASMLQSSYHEST